MKLQIYQTFIFYRFAKSITARALANLEMATPTRETSNMDFFMEKDSSAGLMGPRIEESLEVMKLLVMAVTNGQMVQHMKARSKTDSDTAKASTLIQRKESSIKVNG